MNLTPITSSNVRAVGFDSDKRLLVIQFADGATYQYANVSESVYRDLLAAPSVGSFVYRQIRPVYAAERVEVETKAV